MVKPKKKIRIDSALSELTKTQRRRLKKYSSGLTLKSIANREGVTKQTVSESIRRAKQIIKNKYGNNIAFITDV